MSERVLTWSDPDLPDALRWQVSAALRVQWPALGPVRDPYPPPWQPRHVTLVEADLLLGYAGIVRLTLTHDRQDWQVDCLGRVFVFPDQRGSGRGERLVSAATEAITDGDADLGALLCEPALRSFYARSGWRHVAVGVAIDRGDGAPFPVPDSMLLPVSRRAGSNWAGWTRSPLTVPFAW